MWKNVDNLFALYRKVAEAFAEVVYRKHGEWESIEAPTSAWPNVAFSRSENKDELLHTVRYYSLPKLFIFPNHVDASALRAAGFIQSDRWIGMVRHIETSLPRIPLTEGITCSIIKERHEILEWCELVSASLFNHKKLDVGLFEAGLSRLWDLCVLKHNGKSVATAMMFKQSSTAGFYMVTVDPEYRGKGLGKQLMAFCMNYLHQQGFLECVLQATRDGYPLYRSLGFEEENQISIVYKIK